MLVPAVAAALLLAGCAATGSAVGSGSSGSPTTTTTPPAAASPGSGAPQSPSPGAPTAPAGSTPVGPAQVDATAVPGGYTGQVTVDPAGTTLTVTGTEGGCRSATAELLGQDAARVSVQLVITRTSGGVCSGLAKLVPLSVRLAQPLGTRTVVLSEVQR